jgi:heme A synthase
MTASPAPASAARDRHVRTAPERRGGAVRVLACVSAAATLALIALGGVVRVTGSGMGCGDHWPLCHGRLLPPLDLPTLIEYGHRLAAAVVGVLVIALAVAAWRTHHAARRLATAAAALLVVQVLLGAVTVRLGLPAWTVTLHLATAMLLLAALLAAAYQPAAAPERPLPALDGPAALRETGGDRAGERPEARRAGLATAAVTLGFLVVLAGGLVANLHAGAACHGFPLCSGSLLPPGGRLAGLHWAHRALAFALLVLLAAGFVRGVPGARRPWALALGAGLVQMGLAAAMVLGSLPAGLRSAHAAMGAVVWASLVVLALGARAAAQARHSPAGLRRPRDDEGLRARAYDGGAVVETRARGRGPDPVAVPDPPPAGLARNAEARP